MEDKSELFNLLMDNFLIPGKITDIMDGKSPKKLDELIGNVPPDWLGLDGTEFKGGEPINDDDVYDYGFGDEDYESNEIEGDITEELDTDFEEFDVK